MFATFIATIMNKYIILIDSYLKIQKKGGLLLSKNDQKIRFFNDDKKSPSLL